MTNKFLEQFYENVILARYRESITFDEIIWIDHGKVGLDSWAHFFKDKDERQYVLLYEDFPGGEYFDDGLSHEVIKAGDDASIALKFDNDLEIPNITGWFTLYREK